MVNDFSAKILNLIQTGDKNNISLGLKLAKASQVTIDFMPYEQLFNALVKHQIVKDAKRLSTKLNRIFTVTSLGLSLSELSDIAPFLTIFTSLKNLGVGKEYEYLEEVPEAIFDAHSIESLNLSENGIKELSFKFLKLSELKTLSLSFNSKLSIDSLATVVCQMKNLLHLGLVGCSLKQIPEEIGNLVNLTSLNVASNSLSSLPKSFSNLHNLRSLGLYGNYNLKGLPECIYQLPQLSSLTISRSNATEDQLSRFTKLRPQCSVRFI